MIKTEWEKYVREERARTAPIISRFGFMLDEVQPHVGGERYLMQAITSVSGPKLILIGTRASDQKRVVIKASSHPSGIQEIETERRTRTALGDLEFSYRRFYAPTEILHYRQKGVCISVQEYIEQELAFLDRPLKEQFSLSLEAFKAQESAHATTSSHMRRVNGIFPLWGAREYLTNASFLAKKTGDLDRAVAFLTENESTIERYSGFLTHSDFVPHNIRIRDDKLYLLDHSSIRFGSKYESWARFINFMVLYNPTLADALIAYVRANRDPEELHALKCMRVFRLIEIVAYYTGTLSRSEDSLHKLNTARITFWRTLLENLLHDQPLPSEVRDAYIATRDSLRTNEEKQRQKDLH